MGKYTRFMRYIDFLGNQIPQSKLNAHTPNASFVSIISRLHLPAVLSRISRLLLGKAGYNAPLLERDQQMAEHQSRCWTAPLELLPPISSTLLPCWQSVEPPDLAPTWQSALVCSVYRMWTEASKPICQTRRSHHLRQQKQGSFSDTPWLRMKKFPELD